MDNNKDTYEIRVKGIMASGWADWFGDRETVVDRGDTLLLLRDVDRSTFYGTLRILGDLDRSIVGIRTLGPIGGRS